MSLPGFGLRCERERDVLHVDCPQLISVSSSNLLQCNSDGKLYVPKPATDTLWLKRMIKECLQEMREEYENSSVRETVGFEDYVRNMLI